MKIKLIIPACLLTGILLSKQSQAQESQVSLYAHGLYATALDKSSQKLYNNGYGGVAGVTYGKNNTFFVASVGYTAISSALSVTDPDPNNYGDETYVPIKLGVRQHLPLILSFLYLQADAGAGFISYKSNPANNTRFAFDLGAGARFGPFEAALVWDSFTEKKPDGWSSWLTIQAGFNIGL